MPILSGARFPNLLQVPDALQDSGDAQGLSANSEGEAGFEGALQGVYANMWVLNQISRGEIW